MEKIIMPEDNRKRFLILLRAYRTMITEGYNDPKACAILGTIQPVLPEFLGWLKKQSSFIKIKDMPLGEFVDGMTDIAPLGESALIKLEKKLEAQWAEPEGKK